MSILGMKMKTIVPILVFPTLALLLTPLLPMEALQIVVADSAALPPNRNDPPGPHKRRNVDSFVEVAATGGCQSLGHRVPPVTHHNPLFVPPARQSNHNARSPSQQLTIHSSRKVSAAGGHPPCPPSPQCGHSVPTPGCCGRQ